jgi:hypothetical protein
MRKAVVSEEKEETNPSAPTDHEEWRKLAERASHEMDTTKLIQLVQRLCDELDKESSARKRADAPSR